VGGTPNISRSAIPPTLSLPHEGGGDARGKRPGIDRLARALAGIFFAIFVIAGAPGAQAQTNETFRRFLEDIWPEAKAMGVSRATYDSALRGVELDLTLPDLVIPGKEKAEPHGQAEFTRTPAEYLNPGQLSRLAEQARKLQTEHAAALAKIERELGVQKQFVLAIWGRETAFGTHKAPHYAIQVLANQAYLGRRKEMFRNELLHALKMLEDRIITREGLRSSWAGAMGLTQFMPSEYYTTAYDLDGDGRKDIWTSVPDALASAANQLKHKGWVAGQSWGYEVRLPQGMSCLLEGPQHAQPVREWIKLGVVRTGSREFPKAALDQDAFILTPAGINGPAFLALENYMVIKRYNMSDLYALFVGNLGDRIAGGGPFDTPWADVRQMSARGIGEIQERLKKQGHAISKIDGKAGMNTRALIGAYQKANAITVDCWPTQAVLEHLRGKPGRGARVREGAPSKDGETAPEARRSSVGAR
jgi:lytic murein transglycosylase